MFFVNLCQKLQKICKFFARWLNVYVIRFDCQKIENETQIFSIIFCIFLLFANVLTFHLEVQKLKFRRGNCWMEVETRDKNFLSTFDGGQFSQYVGLQFGPLLGFEFDGHLLWNASTMESWRCCGCFLWKKQKIQWVCEWGRREKKMFLHVWGQDEHGFLGVIRLKEVGNFFLPEVSRSCCLQVCNFFHREFFEELLEFALLPSSVWRKKKISSRCSNKAWEVEKVIT